METMRTDFGDLADIPMSLAQPIREGSHLRKIGLVENNAVSRLQLNLRLELVALLRANEILNPTDFANRKAEVIAMVPPDLCEIPSIQTILNEVRGLNSVNVIIPKTGLDRVRDFFMKYL